MKYFFCAVLASLTLFNLIGAAQRPQGPAMGPDWAFPVMDKVQPAGGDPNSPVKVAGSAKTYTEAQVDDLSNPPDWFPEEHPAMPSIVAKGKGMVFACDSCHLPTGMGHPESATVAGFTVTYLMHQMADMKSGDRKTGGIMDLIAKAISDEDAGQAVAYFAALKPFPYIKVVEATTVPKSYVDAGYMRLPLPGGGQEPLGQRIIVLPEDTERILARDPHGSVTIAYVPPGSIARGKDLVTTGAAGKTIACAICHGETLKGLADVPRIAGIQPIYAFRQMYGIQHGNRGGNSAALMKVPMMNLSEDDMIAISAYLGTLAP
jgi:cytochrome c553